MKALLLFLIVLGIIALGAALIGGFVWGIVRKGRKLKDAEMALRLINQKTNLWREDESPLAEGVRQVLDSYYTN